MRLVGRSVGRLCRDPSVGWLVGWSEGRSVDVQTNENDDSKPTKSSTNYKTMIHFECVIFVMELKLEHTMPSIICTGCCNSYAISSYAQPYARTFPNKIHQFDVLHYKNIYNRQRKRLHQCFKVLPSIWTENSHTRVLCTKIRAHTNEHIFAHIQMYLHTLYLHTFSHIDKLQHHKQLASIKKRKQQQPETQSKVLG